MTKDFTVPLNKEDFKAALEAYSIGMSLASTAERRLYT